MKKILLILTTVMVLLTSSLSIATVEPVHSEETFSVELSEDALKSEETKDKEISGASEKILDNMSKKERKLAEYEDKYNDKFFAQVAYYLDIAQLYSIPVCIIGLAIGAFNFYIIGEKKLDKREQGFGYITAFLCGLVVFQVLPLVFALLVAGK